MANVQDSLSNIMELDGALGAALVDWESGLTLGTTGNGAINVELAASGNTEVLRSKMGVMKQLGISGGIEDLLFTLQDQYHLIRPLTHHPALFLYVVLGRAKGNLGLARHKLRAVDGELTL